MASRRTPFVEGKVSGERILQQLERITGSKTFKHVDRLKLLLTFIVVESLAGRGDQLKEYVIGSHVFEKDASFDPRTDPIVRVVARRLRTRLDRYYREEGALDEIVIELPKGGYAPIFKGHEFSQKKRSVTAALASSNSVVVLPFSDDSPSRDVEYLASGVRQQIIHSLVNLGAFRVRTLELGADKSNPDGDHGAAIVVCGSVRKVGNLIRITAQLIDSATETYLWSDSVTRNTEAACEAEEEICRSVVDRLQAGLSETGDLRSSLRPGLNLAAHNLCVQGRYHLNQRTEEGLRKAADFFEKAIAEDPQYAPAYCGLADAYGLLNHYCALPPMEVWTKVAANAATAVLLDPNSPEARTTLGHVKATQDWDWLGAEAEYQCAIRLDARYPTAHHWYATSCLIPMARLDDALEQMQIAQTLDPVSSIIARDLAVMFLYKQDLETALEQCDHTIDLNPHFSPAYGTLGLVQEQLGDFDESIAAFQRAIQLSPQAPGFRAGLARIYGLQGMHEEVLTTLADLRKLAAKRYVSPFYFALIHLSSGEADTGFEWLRKALEDRWFDLMWMKADPRFKPFRNDPRFLSVCDQIGLI